MGGGVLDHVTVRQAVATLQVVVNLPWLILELDHLPGVTALHLGVIGPGQVPGDALGLVLLFCPLNRTLHNTIIKWIFLKQLEVSLIRKQTSSPFRINTFNSQIRSEIEYFIYCNIPSHHLMKVGVITTLLSCPGGRDIWLLPKLLGVSFGDPIRTLNDLKPTLMWWYNLYK